MSEHRVRVVGSIGHGLEDVPVLDELAVRVEAKDVDPRGLLARPIQVAHVHERQIALNRHPFDLARNALGLPDKADKLLGAVREERVVLNVETRDDRWEQVGLASVEDPLVNDLQSAFDGGLRHGASWSGGGVSASKAPKREIIHVDTSQSHGRSS